MTNHSCNAVTPPAAVDRWPLRDLGSLALVAAAAVTLVTWAGSYVAIAIAARELSPAPFALARLGSAALLLLPMMVLKRPAKGRLPRARDLPAIALMALLGFPLYHTALNAGQRIVEPGTASLLISTLPIFASIVAQVALRERLPARGWLGIATGFAGVALLVAGGSGDFRFRPEALLVLLAALSGAAFMVTQRHLTRRHTGFALTVWGLSLGALMLTPFAPQLARELAAASHDTWLAVAYLGIFPTALAYALWSYVLKSLPAARATSLLFVVPPLVFLFAWAVLGTTPGWLDVVSGLIILAGVGMVQRAPRHAASS